MKKPIYVTRSFLPPMEEYMDEIKNIWENHWLTNQGPIHQKFENALSKKIKSKNVTLFSNGHMALEAALSIFDKGSEVITTPFTFVSTTHAIIRNQLKPIFCDINYDDYTIDTSKIEELITDKTVAIVPVHVYGHPCDVYKLDEIAKKYNLKVIYDAAHVFGVEVDGESISNFGDISMFSLHATKVFHSIEGGFLAYKNDLLKKQFDLIKNFGISGPESTEIIGFNSKMNEFQAAMGVVNLRHLEDEVNLRAKLVKIYNDFFEEISIIKLPCLRMNNVKHNYAYYPIVVLDNDFITRDELFNELAERNIYSRKYFYPIVTELECYKTYKTNTIVAKDISEKIITLPLYGNMQINEINEIKNAINEILELKGMVR